MARSDLDNPPGEFDVMYRSGEPIPDTEIGELMHDLEDWSARCRILGRHDLANLGEAAYRAIRQLQGGGGNPAALGERQAQS